VGGWVWVGVVGGGWVGGWGWWPLLAALHASCLGHARDGGMLLPVWCSNSAPTNHYCSMCSPWAGNLCCLLRLITSLSLCSYHMQAHAHMSDCTAIAAGVAAAAAAVGLWWLQAVIAGVREKGYLQTLSGRRRWLPHICSESWGKRSKAERIAINGTCQGSAADLVKGAMVQLLHDLRVQGLTQHCRLVVQVGFEGHAGAQGCASVFGAL